MIRLYIVIAILVDIIIASDIPTRYHLYKDDLYKEVKHIMPNFYVPPYFGSLVEHESCISLTHSKCWNPASELKTSREQGVGFGQITRAYSANGNLRFDTLSELKNKYPSHLSGLSWMNIKEKPELQLRAMVLLWKDNWVRFSNKGIDYWNKMAFADSAYNGGYKHVEDDRMLCKMKPGCDHMVWFDNVELYSVKSKNNLYGNRSAFDINRHHVRDVLTNRLTKYVIIWGVDEFYMKYPIIIEEE